MTTRVSSTLFRGFDANSYDSGELDFHIAERPVFKDTLSTRDKAELLMQADGKPVMRLVMRDLGYSQEDIDEVMLEEAQRTADAVRGLAEAAFGQNQEDMQTQDMPPHDHNAETPGVPQTADNGDMADMTGENNAEQA